MQTRSISKTVGLIAAPFTPMTVDGKVNVSLIPDYAAKLREDGVVGVFVNGSTGEGLSLTHAERKAIAEAWQAHGRGLKLFIHVGHTSAQEAGDLAAHAQSIGVDAIGLVAPCFFKPALPELIAFCAAVARRAPDTPFYYYHFPSMSGVPVPAATFLREAESLIPSLAGVKFTHESLMDYHQCLTLGGGRFDVPFGRDEILLSALALGAVGAVGSTYNFIAPLYRQIIERFDQGDLAAARGHQAHAQRLVQILIDSGNGIACGKALMALLGGIDCGPCRTPLPAFGDEQMAWLRRRLDAWKRSAMD